MLTELSHCLLGARPSDTAVAYHCGRYYSAEQFADSVKTWVDKLQAQPFQRYALYTEDAYPFAVLLFALLHAGKHIWIPGNNRPGLAEQLAQDCQLLGDWQNGECFDYYLQAPDSSSRCLSPLNPLDRQLVIFTSGSTGQAKPISKSLNQFQLEIATLEQHWGELLGDATALATVSHQHIYGLLFRVLWPLAAGRCFHSQAYINPESLVNAMQRGPAYWIASPAHLKRLDQYSPWAGIAELKAVFSSGGALPESAARQIYNDGGQAVIEIYGSSETGGIAWRRQCKSAAWTLFSGMSLSCIDGNWLLQSPYLEIPPSPPFSKGGNEKYSFVEIQELLLLTRTNLPFSKKGNEEPSFVVKKTSPPLEKGGAGGGFKLDDHITVLADGLFTLHGRSDRIVKIEEKRLSLVDLEQRLMALPWIKDANVRVITQSRDVVAVVAVLTRHGLERLAAQGRNGLIRQLRKALDPWFEPVVLPRKWLFVNTIPLTPQGKIEQRLLTGLLDFDSRKFPQALSLEITAEDAQLGLKVPEDLLYFPDHFAHYPILPGVVQLAWVEHFCKLFFYIDKPFSCMEAVKFMQVIPPGEQLTLTLNWKAAAGKLCFKFSSERGVLSSGRMIYQGHA